MKSIRKFILASVPLLATFQASHAAGISFSGTYSGNGAKQLYLYSVYDEFYNYVTLIDSIPVKDGRFTYQNDTLKTRLYMLAPVSQPGTSMTPESGTYFFLTAGQNTASVTTTTKGRLDVDIPASELQNTYKKFMQKKGELANLQILDSLDALFYAARSRNDTLEMKRIKEESGPYYDEGSEKVEAWLTTQLAQYAGTPFGLYLYYSYQFAHASINTLDEWNAVRQRLNTYDAVAKQMDYYAVMLKRIDMIKKSVVGSIAPNITGLSRQGRPMSLNDFRGKYVLVDFWSSGCSWCRKETPNLLKTFNAFRANGFTILGVSTDTRKSSWIKAIQEDGAPWNHLMLQADNRDAVLNDYSIIGIPEVLLVDPQGKILAKGLRGQQIYDAVQKAVGK